MKIKYSFLLLFFLGSTAHADMACIKILDPIQGIIDTALTGAVEAAFAEIEHSDLDTLIAKSYQEKAFKKLENMESEIRNGNRPKASFSRIRLLQSLITFKSYDNDPYKLAKAIETITSVPVYSRRGPVINWHLAEMYYQQGKTETAIRLLEYIKTTHQTPNIKRDQYLAYLKTLLEEPEPVSTNLQSKPIKNIPRFSAKQLDDLDKDNWGPLNPI